MTNRVYYCIPGIKSDPEDCQRWHRRFVREVHALRLGCADCYPYHAGAVVRRLEQQDHAVAIASVLRFYCDRGFSVVPVTHSNGADLICRALKADPGLELEAVHLVAAAAHDDFEKNGLNIALEAHQVKSVHCYCSKNDDVLKTWARASLKLFGWFGWGYGDLGLDGPQNVSKHVSTSRVTTHWDDTQDHCSWLEGEQFTRTMDRIITA